MSGKRIPAQRAAAASTPTDKPRKNVRAAKPAAGRARRATYADLQQLLSDDSPGLMRQLALEPRDAQLSIPVDGQGLRVHVALAPGAQAAVPDEVVVELNGKRVRVSLEKSAAFQEYRPQRRAARK